jgi:hypothetical protein
MCLAVGKLSDDEDVVITGSKDHYIKVRFIASGTFIRCVVCCALHFIISNASEWNMTTCKFSIRIHFIFVRKCLYLSCVPNLFSWKAKRKLMER